MFDLTTTSTERNLKRFGTGYLLDSYHLRNFSRWLVWNIYVLTVRAVNLVYISASYCNYLKNCCHYICKYGMDNSVPHTHLSQ